MQPINLIEKEIGKMKINLSPRNCLKTAALIGMSLLLPLAASAQQDSGDTHVPALNAPADVDHLQNQAAMTAQQPDPETRAAIQAEMHAGQAVQTAQRKGDDQGLENARANHRAAEMHAEALVARTCGTTPEQIADMRNQGMGWGQIAQNMGVHPGALGLGHDAQSRSGDQAEMRQARARNMETGRSAVHGGPSGAADMGGTNAAMSHGQEQNHTRNNAQSHMSGSRSMSRGGGHSSRAGHSASHGGGHHR
jgi:hypothetical protein